MAASHAYYQDLFTRKYLFIANKTWRRIDYGLNMSNVSTTYREEGERERAGFKKCVASVSNATSNIQYACVHAWMDIGLYTLADTLVQSTHGYEMI